MSDVEYEYSQGDRLNDRNTYFYSEYRGPAFLDAWRASREAACALLPAARPLQLPAAQLTSSNGYDAAQLLRQPQLDRLLQRFEVSKRIYRKFDADFKAIRDSGYDDMDLYLLFGAACVDSQGQAAPVRYLNALLKVVDSLISQRERLSAEQGAHLAWLIEQERKWVAGLL